MRARVFALAMLSCIGGSAASAAPVQANSHNSHPADWSVRVSHAQKLARVTQPEELVVPTALEQMDRNMVGVMQANEQFQQIEAALPGFSKRYYAAARPELEKIFRAGMPELWTAVAEAFASEMTVPEIDSATRFYGSPLGTKLIRLQTQNFDSKTLMEMGLKAGVEGSGPSEEAASSFKSAAVDATISTVADLSPSERSAVVAFGVSPSGRAVRRAAPKVQQAILEWSTKDDSEDDQRMGEIAISVAAQMKNEQKKAQ